MRGTTSVILQLHQILRLAWKMSLRIDPAHIWNVMYHARSNKRQPPPSQNIAPATQNESHDWSASHVKRHLQCAVQQESASNFTKYCACHAKWVSWSIRLTHETSFTIRRASKVTLPTHQVLHLPRKMNLIIDPPHIWSVIYNARNNKRHPPTSPNTAPATKNESQDWSCSHLKRHLPCAEQQHSPSNLTKYCACRAKWNSKIGRKSTENGWSVIYNARPTMIRAWNCKTEPARSRSLLSPPRQRILYLYKITTFRALAIYPTFTKLRLSDSPRSANVMPATNSDTPTSPNIATATKSGAATSPNAAPATKSDIATSPNIVPATKSDRTVTLLNCYCAELLLYWAVTLLSCCFTELLLYCYFTELLLYCYFTEPLLYWTVTLVKPLLYWTVTFLSCYFTELLLYWTVTWLNCFFTELVWAATWLKCYWSITLLHWHCTDWALTLLLLYWAVTLLSCYFTVTLLNCYCAELLLYWAVASLSCCFTELLLYCYFTELLLYCYFTEPLLYWTVTLVKPLLYWTVTLRSCYFIELLLE